MYSVYGDGICIYNDLHLSGAVNALNPKLKLSDNSAGSLEITLPVGNAGYEKLERLSSEIVVKRDNEEIWAGRIIGEKANFQNSRVLTCEGEFAYFNDTTQPPTEYNETTVYSFILALINEHNSKVEENKQFEIGSITVQETISRVTDNETTMEAFKDHLIDKLGGHMRVRRVYDEDGKLHKYVDYLKDYPNTNGQTIRFGENLLDFTRNWDMGEYATVLMPRGAKLDESPIESVDAYLDVSSVNGGSRYVTNEEGIKRFGWIELVVDFEDITEPEELLQKAKEYLENEQFDDVVIDVSAVDLRYLSKDTLPINLLDNVRCISRPHGMDRIFPVTELSIQLDNPANSTYTLGDTSPNSTLTASTRAANAEILERMKSIPNEKTILDKAQDNATSIMNMATQGYVTIIKNQNGSEYLAVSSENANIAYDPSSDTWKSGTKLWKWNINGLAYSKDGGRNFTDAAITMDGAIVANFITTGEMSADRIRTGTLRDEQGNTNWNLSTGILTMKKGSITLGVTAEWPNGRFSVNDEGYLTAEYGKIGGFVINSYSIYNDVLNLSSSGLKFMMNTQTVGSFRTVHWDLQPSEIGLSMVVQENISYICWGKYDLEKQNYRVKLIYTDAELTYDDGTKTFSDSLIFGAKVDLYQSQPFVARYNNKKYMATTLVMNNMYDIPVQIRLQNASGDRQYDVYVINGVIMTPYDAD